MRVKFYLKNPDAKTETALYALINYEGNKLKIYPGESITPKYWNKATQSARATPAFRESPEFNQRLNNIRSTVNSVFLDYRNRNDHAMPAPAILKPLIETALKKGGQSFTFLSYFEDFIKRSVMGKRIDPRSRKSVGMGVTRGYKTTLTHLYEFSRTTKKKVDFATIDLSFHNDYTAYLSASPRALSLNTIGAHFQRIKAVLAEATERGINSNMGFKSKYFVKQTEEADTIYLSEEELSEMRMLDFSNDPRLDNVRDLFLIGAYTGLRFSDFSILSMNDIANGFIRITQTKTGNPVTIPVHSVVKRILDKRNGETPRTISNEKMNAYLKEIGKLMPALNKNETKTITKGGVEITKTLQKWELLTTHTARRSFATNEYLAGTPSLTIMAITGHKTEKSFLKYIRITQDEHAQKIKVLWDKRNRKLKAV